MGIYIKCMEMPEDCDSCEICDIIGCDLWKPMDIGERHPYCPLVDVPAPHGRLIDADEAYRKYSKGHFVSRAIEILHTVIEAEEAQG